MATQDEPSAAGNQAPARKQSVAGITIFEDEELHHDIKPSLLGAFSTRDVLLTVLLAGMWVPIPVLKWWNTRYVITSERLIERKGSVTGSTTEEIRFDDIAGDIRTSQGLLEGLLNKGTVEFEVEKKRGRSATRRESDERESSKRKMDIDRQTVELTGVGSYRQVTNTIRRIAHTEP